MYTLRNAAQDNMPIKKVLGSVKCVKLVHINPTQDKLSVFLVPMEPRQGIEFITLSNPNELKQNVLLSGLKGSFLISVCNIFVPCRGAGRQNCDNCSTGFFKNETSTKLCVPCSPGTCQNM